MSDLALAPRLTRLLGRIGQGARLRLPGVRLALDGLGNPQRALRIVHVAGTNGKGSVCAMVEAMARRAGLRTGLYTSPHLSRFNERIRFDGRPVEDEPFAAALDRAMSSQLPELTFFETMTVAALWAMREAAVDIAIVEVGLGGRLDATNVVEAPLASAVTSIGLDHAEVLGDDLATIGAEKAAIAKAGCPLVVGPVAADVWRSIRRVAARLGADPIWRVACGEEDLGSHRRLPPRSVEVSGGPDGHVRVSGPNGRRARARLGLRGGHQVDNAAVALAVGWSLEDTWPGFVERGSGALAEVRWPGRLERIERRGVTVLLDGAHNPPAAAVLIRALGERHDPTRTTLIFGSMSDKAWRPMLTKLAALANRRFYTEPLRPIAGRTAASPNELARCVPGQWVGEPRATIEHVIAQALPGETILVTGSIFLVGAVRAALLGLQQDDVLPL